jgi:hypothetical protein
MATQAEIDAVEDALVANAAGPASVSVSGQQVTAKTSDDTIKAANYLSAQKGMSQNYFGLRFKQLVPPGGG